jgi:hypothetical protein
MGLRREGAGIRPRRTGRRPHVVLEKCGGALRRALGGHNLRLKPRVRALELSGRPIHGCVEGEHCVPGQGETINCTAELEGLPFGAASWDNERLNLSRCT